MGAVDEQPGNVFSAVPVPVEIRMALSDRLSSLDLPGRPVPPEDWHITLRFLGKTDAPTLDRFIYGLSAAAKPGSFRIGFGRLGAFPNPRKATVLWVGVAKGVEPLNQLNEASESAAVGAGLPPEERPFRPHLTLARIRPPIRVRHLMDVEVDLEWVCDRVVVYETRPRGESIHYRAVETVLLEG